MIEQITKACAKCGEVKSSSEFSRCSRAKSGLHSYCKVCQVICAKQWNARHQESCRESERRWRDKNPEKMPSYVKKWAETNPEKHAAHRAVYKALKAGRLTKGPCLVCGSEIVEGHHDDYTSRLDVIWLCRKHHAERHRMLSIGERATP